MGSTQQYKTNIKPQAVTQSCMTVLGKRVYHGPHLYSHTPMIRIELDLGELEQRPTNKIPGFKEKLLALLPGLDRHGCSYGEAGGFTRRMTEGTWIGHVIEHIALELQTQADMPVTRGKTRSVKDKLGVYNVMFEYEIEKAGLWAGFYALQLVNSILPDNLSGIMDIDRLGCGDESDFSSVEDALLHLKSIANRERLGPTTRSIVEAAKKQSIPAMRLDDESLVQLGWGKNQRRIRGSMTDATSQIAVDAACDKELTKKLLSAARVPCPQGDVVRTLEGAIEAAQDLGYPIVIKPLDGNHGRGVTTNIKSDEEVQLAFGLAKKHGSRIIVEQFYEGRDYRILAIEGRIVAVAERVPAHVIGDGKKNIQELVETVNTDPRRGEGHENVLSKIVIDDHVREKLSDQKMNLASIPATGQRVWLRGTANLSTGGTAIDRTDDIHPANVILMERAARAIGLDIAGIDVVTKDISMPMETHGGGIVEINASPGFRMHLQPSEGRARPVGDAVISMLFKDKPARIPAITITGTNGKSTTTRMVAHIFRQKNQRVGFTSTSGVYINDEMIWEGDASGPQSASIILRDPTVDVAVLETARGGILREGLGIDYCDVGAVLNVTADHLGLGGINTLEDLAAVKSVVVESVKDEGTSVLNADDPLVRNMAEYAGGKICFFSLQGGHKMSAHLREHIEKGGLAVVRENWSGQEEIVIHANNQRFHLMDVKQIPATHGGIAEFNIQNALAATAIAFAMNVEIEVIRAAMANFGSSYEENPGRFNIYDGHGFRVVMDYAHNPAALTTFLQSINKMRGNYRNVIGTVSTPGDRRDEDIREMGRIAAGTLDLIVFREGPDQRGRAPGVVNKLLLEGALSEGFPQENIICVIDEEEAADICLQKAQPGDLVVLSPSDVSGIWKRMREFKHQNEIPYFNQDTRVLHA